MTDVRGKRVFLSGPVTGLLRDEAVSAFDEAWRLCDSRGAAGVYDPMSDVPPCSTHETAMHVCLCELLTTLLTGLYYDLLVSLPGWEASEGATLERQVAEAVGIPCVELGELGGGE